MAVTTYIMDYAVPAGATTHKAVYASSPNAVPSMTGTEGAQANIDNIETSNDVRWSNANAAQQYPNKAFRWYVTETPTRLDAYAEGYNTNGGASRYYKLFIFNNNTLAWEELASHTNGSDTTITGAITSNLSYYKDGNNYIWTGTVGNKAAPFQTATLYDDFVKLEVTYTAAGAGAVVTKTYAQLL